ncbi:acetate--CoA ligase family protein [Mesorhizobium sp.]|uniref:acetate--CoA ligase family protein n=1 Tax=Mesorhizobium sp. TaxID=1871066 RepID=UPI0012216D0E|nr:acetate--CoA ligase family protein [Mesorhizobium sp.]TIO65363.1 MAG: acetate--CoA ligase family protein [Mesorhizobium sp.]
MFNPTRRENLKKFLTPRHIVYVGGDAIRPGLKYAQQIGFTGSLWAVNPQESEMEGVKCYPDIASLPEAPDATFIAVNASKTIEVVEALSKRGAAGAVCHAAGFSEIGADGAHLESRLAAAAGDMAIIGPNCTGAVNFFDRASMTRGNYGVVSLERGIAMIAQSGTVALNFIASDRGLKIGYSVNVGNQSVTTMADLVDVMLDDERVSAIGIYIEGLKDVAFFEDAILRALKRSIPVVVLKAGTSDKGAAAASSHTGAMISPNDVFEAFLQRFGIVRTSSLSEFIETLKLFSSLEALPGGKLAVLTFSGADSSMSADVAAKNGVELPGLSDHQSAAVRDRLSAYTLPANPLDMGLTLWGKQEQQTACYEAMLSEVFDCGMLISNYPFGLDQIELEHWDTAVDALIEAKERTGKQFIYASNLPEGLPSAPRERLAGGGIPQLQGLEDAFAAFSHAVRYKERRETLLEKNSIWTKRMLPPSTEGENTSVLDEWQGKQWLRSIDVNVPKGMLVDLSDLPTALESVKFPVVLKAVGDTLTHKTELAAVRLNLSSSKEVVEAAQEMFAKVPGSPTKFIIEEMITDVVAELIVGLKRDPQFGVVLMLGSGGIRTELLDDKVQLILPIESDEIRLAIESTKAAKLIDGYRGKPPGDMDAAVQAIAKIAAAAASQSNRIVALDVNPLMVRSKGNGAFAVDCLLEISR